MSSHFLIEAIENTGREPDAYSGRGMGGKYCVSFRSTNIAFDLILLGAALGQDDAEKICENVRWDSLGHDFVVYFPSIPWEDEWDGDDEEGDDDEDEYEDDE